jgi:hypothetical protein
MRNVAKDVRPIVLCGQLLLLLLPIIGGACDWNDSKFVPGELIGVWRTDDARYRGRAIELGKDSAVIETGSDQASPESVESVKIQPAGKETTYSIRCRAADGTRHVLTLRFSPSGGGEIRLSHPQNIVWKRRFDIDIPVARRHRATIVPRPLYEIDCIQNNCSQDSDPHQ